MPRKPEPKQAPSPRKGGQGAFAFKGYVRLDATEESRTAMESWRAQQEPKAVLDRLLGLVEEGYKVGIGWASNGYTATMSDIEATDTHKGYVLSAFGRHAESAVLALIYKHDVMLEGDWGNASTEEAEWR